MAASAPTVEEMFQQMLSFQQTTINAIQDLINGSTTTNTRLDSLAERVEALELPQLFPIKNQVEGSNPMNSDNQRADSKSRPSSPIPSDQGDKESSVADPGTSEDLAAVLDAAADTPTLTKRNSAPGKTRRDSFYVRQLGSDENDVTIKYHTKAPDQPESLKKIKYRDVLKHLEALLEYEHKYRIKLPLARTVSQDCIDQILSRFNLSDKQFHDASLPQLLVYLSTICTPSTRQEMTTFLIKYSSSLCTVTKVPTAANISYFVHSLQDYVRKMMRLLEFISFDPKSVKAMPLENFKKDPPGLWLIIQNSIPFSWLKNCLDQHHPDRKNIKSTSAIFAYINLQCKLLKDQEILAKETENMFTGTSADQQRKDASAARYPARSTLHAIPDSSNDSSALVTPALDEFPLPPIHDSYDDPDVTPDVIDEYAFQDEAEDIASTSYDNSAIADDFNYSNRAVVYQDVLDQPSYVQYCYQHFLYPDLNPSSLSSVSTPVPKLDKKMMPCFQHAKQNCPKKADECQYSHDRAVIKAYLDAQHAKVTGSKKAIHDKTKETFKALNKSPSFRPSQIQSNNKPRPIPTGTGHRPTISSISNTPAISLHNPHDLANHYDDFMVTDGIGRDLELHERIERISGLNLLDSAIHSDCVVTSSLILQDGSKIPSRTLADTGCTRDNFMSESHFLAHPVLQQYIVKHHTNTIDLATHGSTATVSQYISIVIEIVHRSKPIRCKILVGIMKGLRYDLVLGLTVLASHYTDVLLDLLQFQLVQPAVLDPITHSFSMMAAHHVLQGKEFPAIHPQMLHNWQIDHRSLDLYRIKPRTFVVTPQLNRFPHQFYDINDAGNQWFTSAHITSLLSAPALEARVRPPEATAVLNSLHAEALSTSLPLFTDDEAQVVRDLIAPHNPTLANYLLTHSFPNTKLRPMHLSDLRRLLHHRSWYYPIRPTHVDPDYDDDITVLRIFVMFIYHGYILPDHYQDSQVLYGEPSSSINDILRKLYDEAKNMVKQEIFARNHITPNQRLAFTSRMRDLLFIMVCRQFAYGGTINKILPFKQEIEDLLADHTPFDAVLFKRLHGLLIPFRLPAIPYNAFYDPNHIQTYNENHRISYIQRCSRMQHWISTVKAGAHPRFYHANRLLRAPEPISTSFQPGEIYSFSMFVIENSGPLQPLTCEDLRLLLTEGGIIDRMDVHDLHPHALQFTLPELCGILYLLYTHKLNPEFFRGLMLPYALSQQLSNLVLLQTLNYFFFAVQHVHHTQPDHASHFLVWAKVNIASFQRFAISSLAFAAPDVTVFLNHVVNVYTTASNNGTFPPFVTPREPLDTQVLLGRACCKLLLLEHKFCNSPVYSPPVTHSDVLLSMTRVDHHYVINRHAANEPISHLHDLRAFLPGHRLDDIPYLIPFWALDNSYTREPHSLFPAALIASYTIDPNDASQWIRPPYRDRAPSDNRVDQLIAYSHLYHPIRFDLRDNRHRSLQPLFDDPEYDPNLYYEPTMRHNTPPLVEVEGADDDPTSRASNEIAVIDPLDPSLAPILVRTSQDFESSDDDDDLISNILPPAEESIEDDTSSDIPENQDDPHSDQDDIPSPVLPDSQGKRPRDDHST